MSVLLVLITVTLMLHVLTLPEALSVPVCKDLLEMASFCVAVSVTITVKLLAMENMQLVYY